MNFILKGDSPGFLPDLPLDGTLPNIPPPKKYPRQHLSRYSSNSPRPCTSQCTPGQGQITQQSATPTSPLFPATAQLDKQQG